MSRALLLLVPALLLAACVRAPVRIDADATLLQAQAEREQTLAAERRWGLVGRLAVSDGRDGGSGRIEWRQDGEDFDIRLSAPVSRQSWRLTRVAGLVTLDGVEGGPHTSHDPQRLLWETTGWLIPVDALADWVRGARARGAAEIAFDPEGLPALLVQQGWRVEYRAWDRAEPPRPLRVFANQGEARVRLQVDRWDSPSGAAAPVVATGLVRD